LELRWWLASFGSKAEVVEPDELRQHFAKEAELLMGCYQ
jgi:predicted DNA-binding transcriptional regulator YafY